MSRLAQTFFVLLIVVLALGCSGSVKEQSRVESSTTPAADDDWATEETTATTTSTSGSLESSPTGKVDESQQKLRALAIEISEEDPTTALRKMKAIFSAADKNSRLAKDSHNLARYVISETKNAKTKQFAQQYLIFASMKNGASDRQVFKQLERFARDHQTSRAPIDLYRNLADRLANAGDGSRALQFLDHGIRVCAKHPQQQILAKHRKMTQQTMMLTGGTRTVSYRSTASRSKDKDLSKYAPKTKSEFAMFKGKRPRLSGSTLKGRRVSPSDLRGKWTYVHFWATWCGPCRAATPKVASLKRRYEKKGVKFVGVNLDSDQDAAREFIKKHNIDWPQISGTSGKKLSQSLGVKGVPVSMFVSRDGVVVSAGRTASGDLKKQIEFSLGFEKGLEKGLKKRQAMR